MSEIPKRGKIYQIVTELPNGHKIYQLFPVQGPPKFTQIGIFGMKINHLATLVCAWKLILMVVGHFLLINLTVWCPGLVRGQFYKLRSKFEVNEMIWAFFAYFLANCTGGGCLYTNM
jgi:hypothetical protein